MNTAEKSIIQNPKPNGPAAKPPMIWRHLCASGGMQPGDGSECQPCQEAQRLPLPAVPSLPRERMVTIPVALARLCLTGLDCHLTGIEDKLKLRGLNYATRSTLERAQREYATATTALQTAIAAAR